MRFWCARDPLLVTAGRTDIAIVRITQSESYRCIFSRWICYIGHIQFKMADDNVFTNTCQFALEKFGFPTFKESQKDCYLEEMCWCCSLQNRENPSCFSLFPWYIINDVTDMVDQSRAQPLVVGSEQHPNCWKPSLLISRIAHLSQINAKSPEVTPLEVLIWQPPKFTSFGTWRHTKTAM